MKLSGLHKKLNSFFKGRSVLSLEKAIALLACFLNKHNEDISKVKYMSETIPSHNILPFTAEDVYNYGIVFRDSEPTLRDESEIDSTLLSEMKNKINTMSAIVSEMSNKNEIFKPLEVILNCPFEGLPLDCERNCLQESRLQKIMASLNFELDEKKSSKLLSILCLSMNPVMSESDFFQMTKKTLMNNFDNFKDIFSSKKYHRKFTRDLLISDDEPSTRNILARAAAYAMNSVITVISCAENSVIQTIIPQTHSLNENHVVIAFSPHESLFYCVKLKSEKITNESTSNDIVNGQCASIEPKTAALPQKDSEMKSCTCGRGNKRKKKSCTQSRCPCLKRKQSCNDCHCLECDNPFGKQSQEKNRPCRCGESSTKTTNNCNKNRCPCFKNGWSCETNPQCSCKKCENSSGKKLNSEGGKKKHRAKRRSIASSGKVLRFTSENSFYAHIGIKQKQSAWRESETIALFLCQLHFSTRGDKIQNIHSLYNEVSKHYCELELRLKSLKQVSFKLRNIHTYDGLYNTDKTLKESYE